MRSTPVFLLASAILASAPAFASSGDQGDWELGLFAGYASLDNYREAHPKNGPLYGLRFGYFFNDHLSVEASGQQVLSKTRFSSGFGLHNQDVNITGGRLNFLWNFRPGEKLRPFLTGGFGFERTRIDRFLTSTDPNLNAGGGVRWLLTDSLALRLDGRLTHVAFDEPGTEAQNNVETSLGLSWMLGGGPPPDEDHDGVPDRKDKCPGTPAGATVDEAGCPHDSDGDGIWDGLDACPDTPKGYPVDAKGCPTDTDGDGVPDGADKCPGTQKGATVDAAGCPSDEDGDGVPDGLDRCPRTPRGAVVDASGCPLDGDHDGVFDGLDRCPDTRAGAKVDANGCEMVEKAPPLFPSQMETLVLEGVNFETDRWDITGPSREILDRVWASLTDWDEVRVEIGGHTDSTSSTAHNQALSERRAESVKAYLVSKGIAASRLVAKGYGETKPIADNRTDDGKRKNRRVELTRLD